MRRKPLSSIRFPPVRRLPALAWGQRWKALRVAAWAVVFGGYMALALAWLYPQHYRDLSRGHLLISWGAFLAAALQFHIGLALLAVGLVGAFTRGKRLFLAAVPAVVLTVGPGLLQYLPRDTPPPAAAAGPKLRLFTANVLQINPHVDRMLAEIRRARPDVVLLQEYQPEWHPVVSEALKADYPHSVTIPKDTPAGLAVYSRFPFDGPARADVAPGLKQRPQVRVVLDLGRGRRVAIYNVHPRSPMRFWNWADSRVTFADLRDALAGETLPCVVAGDFNFTETTPQHRELLRMGFAEAHARAGRGRGSTFPDWPVLGHLPGIRIDHIYLRGGGLVAQNCETRDDTGSDHRPVIVDLAFEK